MGSRAHLNIAIRHLYNLPSDPKPRKDALIAFAKANCERRRCNHHTLEEPLSTLDCFTDVIDPKKSQTNKHRYVVASQDDDVRRLCRNIKGVPLVYIKRSVLLLEPMAESSLGVREGIEKGKLKSGIRGKERTQGTKRKREDKFGAMEIPIERITSSTEHGDVTNADSGARAKQRRARGPKGPNPLSIKKPKKVEEYADPDMPNDEQWQAIELQNSDGGPDGAIVGSVRIVGEVGDSNLNPSRKRKRKHRPKHVETGTEAHETAIDRLGAVTT